MALVSRYVLHLTRKPFSNRFFSTTAIKMAGKIAFKNGKSIPIVGLGTWKSGPGEVTQAVKAAIDTGYRHIDAALLYENEKEVGEGIQSKISEGKISREDVFVTSKLWNTFHRPDLVEASCQQSLDDLGLQYLDLYLIHNPMAWKEDCGVFPIENGKILYSDVDIVDTWKAMENLVTKGMVKSIGVSNFNSVQIQKILDNCTIAPVNNQVECHPYLNQAKLIKFCKDKGITVTAYSPFGSPDRPWAAPGDPLLLEDPMLIDIGKNYGKSPAQVIIRWMVLIYRIQKSYSV